MEYEWDSDKDVENRRKHGLALADGITALEDPDAVERLDDRFLSASIGSSPTA